MKTTVIDNQNLTKRNTNLTTPTEVGRLDRYRYLLNKYSNIADQISDLVSAQIDVFDNSQPDLLLRLADYSYWVNIVMSTLQTYLNRVYVLKNKELIKTISEIMNKLNRIKNFISSNSEEITNNMKIAIGLASDGFNELHSEEAEHFPEYRNVHYIRDRDLH